MKIKFSPVLLSGILIALFFTIALCLRVFLPYDKVFSGDWIKFTGADAYYHMRLIDNLVYNFPHVLSFDPYLIYPGGAYVGAVHLFNSLLGGIIWLVGLGSPTQHTIDVVSVYFPAVLGALTVIPVYFIGKELFGRWAGVLSAGLLAILPGEFLGRSILGFTDYHITETLFTTVTMLFLILAIKAACQRQLTFNHLKHLNWTILRKPFLYSLLAGIFLGIYIRTWSGALLFVFITAVYFVIQFIIDYLKNKSTEYLCLTGVAFFFIALLISLPVSVKPLYLASLVIAILIPLALSSMSWLLKHFKIKPVYYPLSLLGLGIIGWVILYLVSPSLLGSMLSSFSIFNPTGPQLTTIEMRPLISSDYGNPFIIAWANYPGLIPYDPEVSRLSFWNVVSFISSSFFLSLVSLAMLLACVLIKSKWSSKMYPGIEQGSADKVILIVWSLVVLLANLGQRRFGYYFAVNVALLTGYLSWRILEIAGFKELTTIPKQIVKGARSKKIKPRKGSSSAVVNNTVMGVVLLIVFLVVFAPSVFLPEPNTDKSPTVSTASATPYAPSDAWYSSLSWLKENTPEPFGNANYYYESYQSEQSYSYPESAYGVLAWWDYGYWITRIAHRPPNANPGQDPQALTRVASFFTSQDEEAASIIIKELDSAYIIIDYNTTYAKFWAIATWAGMGPSKFFDSYFVPQDNQLIETRLYYPEYYHSLAVRLYNFNGKAVTPESVLVISYQENTDESGNIYKVITDAQQFNTYEEAEAYLLSLETANSKIVSTDPMLSPVPLEALEHYRLVYSSNSTITLMNTTEVPEVKIFEYIE
jgi:dolichyl-diphosphooligosaccharide--protein glycosyltransferase